jgi:uncharacterized protein with HEPN domain
MNTEMKENETIKLSLNQYLRNAQKQLYKAFQFIGNMTEKEFFADEKTQYAVTLCHALIGENFAKIIKNYSEFVEMTPQINWKEIRGMRNIIIHEYNMVDFEIVWDTTIYKLPVLEKILAQLLQND